jgi:hypothetical protein
MLIGVTVTTVVVWYSVTVFWDPERDEVEAAGFSRDCNSVPYGTVLCPTEDSGCEEGT